MDETSSVNVTLGATLTSSFSSSFQKANKALKDLQTGFQSTLKSGQAFSSSLDKMPGTLDNVERATTRVKRAKDSLRSSTDTLSTSIKAVNDNFATSIVRANGMETAFVAAATGMGRFNTSLSETARFVSQYIGSVETASTATSKAIAAYNDTASALAQVTSGYRNAIAAMNEYASAARSQQRLAGGPSIRRLGGPSNVIEGSYTDVTPTAALGYRGSSSSSGGSSVPPTGRNPFSGRGQPFFGGGSGGGSGGGGGHRGGLGRGHGFVGGSMAHALIGGSAVYMGGRLIHKGYEAGAESQALDYEMINTGLTPAQIKKVNDSAEKQSRATPQFSVNEIRKNLLESRTAFGGDIDKAIGSSDFILKIAANMKAVRPDQDTLGQVRSLVKSDEMRGITNPDEYRRVMEGQEKAFVYSGGQVTGDQFLATMKMAKSGGLTLDENFMTQTMPQLMYEMGAPGTGTALNSFMTSFVGNRMPKADVKRLAALGVYDEKKLDFNKAGNVIDVGKDALNRSDLAASNPEKYVNEFLIPLLQKSGIVGDRDQNGDFSEEQQAQIAKFLPSVISNTRTRDLISKLATQGARFRRGAETSGLTKSNDEQYANNQNRADQAFMNMSGAFENMLTTMTKSNMPMVASLFNGIATAMDKIASLPPGVLGNLTLVTGGLLAIGPAMSLARLAFSTFITPVTMATARMAAFTAEMTATQSAAGLAAVPLGALATSITALLAPLALVAFAAKYQKDNETETAKTWNTPQAQALPDLGKQSWWDFLTGNAGVKGTVITVPEGNKPVHFDDQTSGYGPQAMPQGTHGGRGRLPVTKAWSEDKPEKKFATGGSFLVKGSGGWDNNVVNFRASDGERVTVETPDQQNSSAISLSESTNEIRRMFGDVGKSAAIDFTRQFKAEMQHQSLMDGLNPGSNGSSYGSAVGAGSVSGGPSLRYGRSGSSAGLPSLRYGPAASGHGYHNAPAHGGSGATRHGPSQNYGGGAMPSGDGTDPTSLKGVLFKGESGGNPGIYNHRVGGRYAVGHFDANTMTIGDLQRKQAAGEIFAAGKYQVIPQTMKGAVAALGLKPGDKFDSATQDRIFTDYLAGSKRPDISNFITGKGSSEDAAHKALAYEWASVAYHGHGMYDKDGVNHASVSDAAANGALEKARETYKKLVAGGTDSNTARRAALLGIKDVGATPAGTAAVGNYYEKHAPQKNAQTTPAVSHTTHAPITINPQPHHDTKQIARDVVKHLDDRDKTAALRSSTIDWQTG